MRSRGRRGAPDSAEVAAAARSRADTRENPIRRIVSLLQKMQEEIEAEGARDEEMHEKFGCGSSRKNG